MDAARRLDLFSTKPGPSDEWLAGCAGLICRIGDTPLVRIREAVKGLVPPGVEIWGKCEWFNPGGSVKDRAALAMVLDAERRGALRPGSTLLDASSGNTGISYAMIAAARGYRLMLCLPSNANSERKALLSMYGAEVVLTDPLEGSDGAIREAQRLHREPTPSSPTSTSTATRRTGGRTTDRRGRRSGGRRRGGSPTSSPRSVPAARSWARPVLPGPPRARPVRGGPARLARSWLGGPQAHGDGDRAADLRRPGLADRKVAPTTDASYELARRLAAEGLLVGPSAAARCGRAVAGGSGA
jgi:cysteine synthase B